jgi:hypothetical protein
MEASDAPPECARRLRAIRLEADIARQIRPSAARFDVRGTAVPRSFEAVVVTRIRIGEPVVPDSAGGSPPNWTAYLSYLSRRCQISKDRTSVDFSEIVTKVALE